MDGSERRERLHASRLYLVTGTRPGGRSLAEVLEPALRGGVDLVQLRAKDAGDEEILAAAAEARPLCAAAGALLLVNDRPDLAVAAGADGVHVGQDDMAVSDARAITGVDPASVTAVVEAGATRIAVVRAITDADDPEAAAAALRAALPVEVTH